MTLCQFIVENELLFCYAFNKETESQKKRSRQSDVMSDLRNMDVTFGKYPREHYDGQEEDNENEIPKHYPKHLSENCGLTEETSRAINSELSSQVSREQEKLKSKLNAQILEVINSAIAEKVLPLIENAIRPTKITLNTKWDLWSDGLHQAEFAQAIQNGTFDQMDCITICLHNQLRNVTFGQTNCIRVSLQSNSET